MSKTRLLTQNVYKSWFLESLIDTHKLWTIFVSLSSADPSLDKKKCQLKMLHNQGKEVLSFGTTSNVPM